MIATRSRSLILRPATLDDVPALEALIARSARSLGRGYYAAADTEAAIAQVFGVDSELIADGAYLVATEGDLLAGCGGWSGRATLFGGDRFQRRSSARLDPARDPARIRAFFVDPDRARRGVATALLAACEAAAHAAGFRAATLMATLAGVPFYAAHGFRAEPRITLDLTGRIVAFVPMSKLLP